LLVLLSYQLIHPDECAETAQLCTPEVRCLSIANRLQQRSECQAIPQIWA
jgi:hypothetical protein